MAGKVDIGLPGVTSKALKYLDTSRSMSVRGGINDMISSLGSSENPIIGAVGRYIYPIVYLV